MQIVKVKFNKSGDVAEFYCHLDYVRVSNKVIVEEEGVTKLGVVVATGFEKQDKLYPRVLRVATEKDLEQAKQNEVEAKKALEETKAYAQNLNLDMKVVSAEYSFDTSKLIISFVADNRVDFRDLVKYLASAFKTRIELRQIGVRDETKLLGGFGICGRKLCCANHLKNMDKVSIKMAKNQGLSLNPQTLSGTCGRYMCCLAYEDEHYASVLQKMPKLNSRVKTPDGEGIVSYNNVLKEQVSVKFVKEDGSFSVMEYPLSQIKFTKA